MDHQHLSPAGGGSHGFQGQWNWGGGKEGEISRCYLSIKGKYRKLTANEGGSYEDYRA